MSNLINAKNKHRFRWKPWKLAESKEAGLKVGITARVKLTVSQNQKVAQGDANVRFDNKVDGLKDVWKSMEESRSTSPSCSTRVR